MKIKDEYKGKTIVKNTSLGNMKVVVDNIDVSKYRYYVSIGFGYLFEKESETLEKYLCGSVKASAGNSHFGSDSKHGVAA